MPISPERYKYQNEKTNVATTDFRTVKDNKTMNDKEKEDNNENVEEMASDSESEGLLDGLSDAVDSVSEIANEAMDVVNGVKDKINETISAVKGVVDDVMSTVNQVKNAYNAVARFCQNPSLSSLAGAIDGVGMLGGLSASVGSMLSDAAGPLKDAMGSLGQVAGEAGSLIGEGLKTVSDVTGSVLTGVGEWATKAVGTASAVMNVANEVVGKAEQTFTALYKFAENTKIPGVLSSTLGGAKNLADLTGMSKAAANVLGTTSKIKSTFQLIETSKTQIANSFKNFAPNVTEQVINKASVTDPNTTIANNGAETLRKVQDSYDSTSNVSNDGKVSTKTSDGTNKDWSFMSWSRNSSSVCQMDSNGVVYGTCNQDKARVSEYTKTTSTAWNGYLGNTTYTSSYTSLDSLNNQLNKSPAGYDTTAFNYAKKAL